MRLSSLAVLLALSTVSAAPAWSQIQVMELFRSVSTPASPTHWHSNADSGSSFEALYVGKLHSPWDPDAISLRGGELQVAVAMAKHDRVTLLASDQTGALLLPGQGYSGLDALLSTNAGSPSNPTGVLLWTKNASGNIVPNPVAGLSNWQGAHQLRLGAANKVYAIDSSGYTIRKAIASDGGLSSDGALTLTTPVQDICPLDFDWDGVEDLAVVHATWIEVWYAGFNAVWTSPGTNYNNHITVSRGHGGERDVLIWAGDYAMSEGTPVLAAFNSQRTDPLLLTGVHCGGLASLDYDDSVSTIARDDVLFSRLGSHDVTVYRRHDQAGSVLFGVPNLDDQFDLGWDDKLLVGTRVAGGDIDGDADVDVLFGLHDRDMMRCALNGRIERHDLAPKVVALGFLPGAMLLKCTSSIPTATSIQIELRAMVGLWAPATLLLNSSIPIPDPSVVSQIPFYYPDGYDPETTEIFELTMRESGPASGGGTAYYPTVTYFFHVNEAALQALAGVPEIQQYLAFTPHGTGVPGISPPTGGYTPGGGGRGN